MKTFGVVIAVLSLAAPAFAQDYGYGTYTGDDDWSWQQDEDAPPPPQAGPTLDDFRNDGELSWNGEWISTPEYGVVWHPTHVSSDWQPYMYGSWVWTDAGWAWASDEPFGWAVYHYGRWAWLPEVGWTWVPGRVWGPAWVSWRWNDGYTAWCPLGPSGVVYRQPTLWVVVPNREFLQPVPHHVVPRSQRPRMPLPAPGGPRAGPPVTVVERATGHSVRPLAIGEGTRPGRTQTGGGAVWFYRPRTAPVAVPPRTAVREPEPGRAPANPGRPYAAPGTPHPGAPRTAPPTPVQGTPHASAPRTAAPAAPAAPHATQPHVVAPKSSSEQPQTKER